MDFQATPTNMTELLVVALACWAVIFLIMKRYTSNLPLLFYGVAVAFAGISERRISPYLFYTGMALAMLLRFEFMNNSFSKVVAFLATTSMIVIIVVMITQVFGSGGGLF